MMYSPNFFIVQNYNYINNVNIIVQFIYKNVCVVQLRCPKEKLSTAIVECMDHAYYWTHSGLLLCVWHCLSTALVARQVIQYYTYIVNHNNYCSNLLLACSTNNALRLYNQNGNITTEGGMLQICRSGIWRAACDYSFGCTTDGRAACRQLGYSGSQMSMCTNVCYCAACSSWCMWSLSILKNLSTL